MTKDEWVMFIVALVGIAILVISITGVAPYLLMHPKGG